MTLPNLLTKCSTVIKLYIAPPQPELASPVHHLKCKFPQIISCMLDLLFTRFLIPVRWHLLIIVITVTIITNVYWELIAAQALLSHLKVSTHNHPWGNQDQ